MTPSGRRYPDVDVGDRNAASRPLLRRVSMAALGATASPLLGLAAAPVLSRVYSPSAFGVLGAFGSVLGILQAFASLQLGQAILYTRTKASARLLHRAAIRLVFVAAALCATVAVLAPPRFSGYLDSRLDWLLVSGTLFAAGVNQVNYSWLIRSERLGALAAVQWLRAIVVPAAQFLLRDVGDEALLLGLFVGEASAAVVLSFRYPIGERPPSLLRVRTAVAHYSGFIRFSTPQAALNAVGQGLPVLLLAGAYPPMEVGAYAFAMRLLVAPATLVSTSLNRTIAPSLADLARSPSALVRRARNITKVVAALSVPAVLVVAVSAPWLFATSFGEAWGRAGELSQWLVLWVGAGILNGPAQARLRIEGFQRGLLVYEAGVLGARAIVLLVGGRYFSMGQTIASLALFGAASNLALVAWGLRSGSVAEGSLHA